MAEKKGIFDLLVQDVLAQLAQPETHLFLESHVIRPMIHRIFRNLYPYFLGVLILWILMFACLAVILLLIMRSK